MRARPPNSTLTAPGSDFSSGPLRSGVPGVIRAHTRRRRTISDTTNPAIMVIANSSTHTWPGSWDTWRLTNGVAPLNRTTVPSSRRTCSPCARLIRLTFVSRFCSISRVSNVNSDCGRPVSSPASPR